MENPKENIKDTLIQIALHNIGVFLGDRGLEYNNYLAGFSNNYEGIMKAYDKLAEKVYDEVKSA